MCSALLRFGKNKKQRGCMICCQCHLLMQNISGIIEHYMLDKNWHCSGTVRTTCIFQMTSKFKRFTLKQLFP